MKCQTCGADNTAGSHFCISCGTRLSASCHTCGRPLLANGRFCAYCGTPVPVGSQGQPRTTIQPGFPVASPFERIKARSLVLWALAGLPILVVLYALAYASAGSFDEGIDPFFDLLILSGWLYGLFVAWGLWKTARNRVDFGSLIGRIPMAYRWRSVFVVVALLIVFSFSTFWITLYWLAVNVPEAAEFFATGELFATGEFTEYAGLYNIAVVVLVVLVAPVVEEFIFRGLLLTRWSLRWGTTSGILVSSLLFALLHTDPVGAFAFGVVLSLLYIRTRTLLVPMIAHGLNNLLAVVFSALALTVEAEETVSLVDDLESGLTVAVVGAIVTLPLVIWYVVRNWPRAGESVPFLAPGTTT